MASTGTHQRKPGKRGKVSGWSPGAARRNTAFLRSVDERTLDGHGLALTLTLRDCPATVAEWSKLQQAWIERQRRRGMIRLHWVMEFQRRGVPHLHVAIWYAESPPPPEGPSVPATEAPRHNSAKLPTDAQRINASVATANADMQQTDERALHLAMMAVSDWVEITAHLGTGPKGQHARPISDEIGWFMYLAKHCGRGRQHYQRQQESIPEAWQSSPRVWGKSGSWSLLEPVSASLTSPQWYAYRRLVKRWRVARARAVVPGPGWTWSRELLTRPVARSLSIAPPGQAHRTTLGRRLTLLQQARAMLRCGDSKLSPVRGVSEWISEPEALRLLEAVNARP